MEHMPSLTETDLLIFHGIILMAVRRHLADTFNLYASATALHPPPLVVGHISSTIVVYPVILSGTAVAILISGILIHEIGTHGIGIHGIAAVLVHGFAISPSCGGVHITIRFHKNSPYSFFILHTMKEFPKM